MRLDDKGTPLGMRQLLLNLTTSLELYVAAADADDARALLADLDRQA